MMPYAEFSQVVDLAHYQELDDEFRPG